MVSNSTQEDRSTLLASIIAGLASTYTRYSIDGLQKALGEYRGISQARLRTNFARFLPEFISYNRQIGHAHVCAS